MTRYAQPGDTGLCPVEGCEQNMVEGRYWHMSEVHHIWEHYVSPTDPRILTSSPLSPDAIEARLWELDYIALKESMLIDLMSLQRWAEDQGEDVFAQQVAQWAISKIDRLQGEQNEANSSV